MTLFIHLILLSNPEGQPIAKTAASIVWWVSCLPSCSATWKIVFSALYWWLLVYSLQGVPPPNTFTFSWVKASETISRVIIKLSLTFAISPADAGISCEVPYYTKTRNNKRCRKCQTNLLLLFPYWPATISLVCHLFYIDAVWILWCMTLMI